LQETGEKRLEEERRGNRLANLKKARAGVEIQPLRRESPRTKKLPVDVAQSQNPLRKLTMT
jgi:hypothetical protein